MTLLARVTRGAVLFACASALLAASATSALTQLLVQREGDRRLHDAAVVLADELGSGEDVREALADEQQETRHMGLLFAVFDEQRRLAGDARLAASADGCLDVAALRACAVTSSNGLHVVAAGPRAVTAGWLGLAALVSVLVSAVLALVASRPLAQALVAPLTRLRARLETLQPGQRVELGEREGVEEIDSLRDALSNLLERLGAALAQAERFSANAAHELRTPLTAIRGQLELMSAEDARLAPLRLTVARLETLVERLLVLATPDEAPATALESLSLRDQLEDVLRELPGRERVELHVESDPTVRADGALVQSMLTNALQNALRFGTKVRVTLGQTGSQARVLVEDDGPGVPLAERERVFEAFHRLSEGGHGLGLALIAHLARRYGGAARFLDSEAGARLELTFARVT